MKSLLVMLLLVTGIAQAGEKSGSWGDATAEEAIAELDLMLDQVDVATAPIRSKGDLARHLRDAKDSPLSALPPAVRAHFLGSLVFSRHGLASYSYLGLDQVSITDLHRILQLFGATGHVVNMPHRKAASPTEASILLAATLRRQASGLRADPVGNHFCVVSGSNSWCQYEYGSNCNDACR